MEILESPQHCALPGGHTRSPPARVRVDAWGGIAAVYVEESEHKSDKSRESSSVLSGHNLTLLLVAWHR